MAKLYFKYGAMKSGKTTEIIKTYYNYIDPFKGNKKVLIMKPGDDKKAGAKIQSRSGAELNTDYVVPSNVDVYGLIAYHLLNNNVDVIIVDEAQFLTPKQVDELILDLIKLMKNIFQFLKENKSLLTVLTQNTIPYVVAATKS